MSTTSISQTKNLSVTKSTRTHRLKLSWIDKKTRFSPKVKQNVDDKYPRVNTPSNFYAGPSFTDSPVPQLVPLPPIHWLENSSECACGNYSFCKISQSCSIRDHTITSSLCGFQSLEGIRLTPLQLIEAAAS